MSTTVHDSNAIKVRLVPPGDVPAIEIGHVGATDGKICRSLRLHGTAAIWDAWPEPKGWPTLDFTLDWRGEQATLIIAGP